MFWLIVENYDNWCHDRENSFAYYGIAEKKIKLAETIKNGDILITYVSGKSAFADVRKVQDDKLLNIHRKHQYDIPFRLAVSTKPIAILDEAQWIPMKCLVDKLSFTKHLKSYGMTMINPLRKLDASDAALIIDQMEANSNTSIHKLLLK